MIAGIFHEGSGLGDQLFRYITTRTLAEDKGLDFGMCNPELFKGNEFMSLESGGVILDDNWKLWSEKDVRDSQGNDIRSYDPEINFVEDNTIIDGSFEDSKYWGHNLENINTWLKVVPANVPDDLCIIGFRGGEYASNPDLFLTQEYYEEAISKMLAINPKMRFEVHTDDPIMASVFFSPEFNIIKNEAISHSKHTNMEFNWRSARYAKYAIIPNSAFFIIPRLLQHLDLKENGDVVGVEYYAHTIAPRYWARHNQKIWARPACYYKQFTYI